MSAFLFRPTKVTLESPSGALQPAPPPHPHNAQISCPYEFKRDACDQNKT